MTRFLEKVPGLAGVNLGVCASTRSSCRRLAAGRRINPLQKDRLVELLLGIRAGTSCRDRRDQVALGGTLGLAENLATCAEHVLVQAEGDGGDGAGHRGTDDGAGNTQLAADQGGGRSPGARGTSMLLGRDHDLRGPSFSLPHSSDRKLRWIKSGPASFLRNKDPPPVQS